MKRPIHYLLIACAVSFLLASCGPDKAAIQAKARYFVDMGYQAGLNGDYDRIQFISSQEQAYLSGLSEDELEIYNAEVMRYASSRFDF